MNNATIVLLVHFHEAQRLMQHGMACVRLHHMTPFGRYLCQFFYIVNR